MQDTEKKEPEYGRVVEVTHSCPFRMDSYSRCSLEPKAGQCWFGYYMACPEKVTKRIQAPDWCPLRKGVLVKYNGQSDPLEWEWLNKPFKGLKVEGDISTF